ncbi:hypothetical protein [Leptospira andrefontaineae]|uniref:Uncharacterized protein n=1 Tax=Leptospira andrefontaineae TaxID=2484976 RepID=A0A4R9H6M1_9LEPT|nr:hypothetical protein [Leptospira andrefontaineae]TGK41243.1 hypothetical protein EHO65_07375 [Leptospira andrefontaineae]
MLEQIIFQQLFQLTQNGVTRQGLSEEESSATAVKTINVILEKSKIIAPKMDNPNVTLIFQQISQVSIAKILGGADPLNSVDEAAKTIESLIIKSKQITLNSGLIDL